MCGIVGMMAGNGVGAQDRTKFFENALYADAVRGHDSTGVFVVNRQHDTVDMFKRAVTAYDYLGMSFYDKFRNKYNNAAFVVGHNRKATRGAVHNMTAHPFEDDGIIMVYNGTLTNHRTFPQGNSYDVDSEALCHALAKMPAKEVLEKAIGSFAVVWYDQDKETLNLARNDQRPLHYAYCANEDAVLFASEPMMLVWTAYRNGIMLDKVNPLPVGKIFSFKSSDLDKPEVIDFTPHVPIATRVNNVYSQNRRGKASHNRSLPGPSTVKKHAPTGDTSNKGGVHPPANEENTKVTSTMTKRKAKSIRRLRRYGLKYGDEVIFEAVTFDKFPKGVNGELRGLHGSSKNCVEIVDYCLNEHQYAEGGTYQGQVYGIKCGKRTKDDLVIVCNSVRIDGPVADLPNVTDETKEVDKSSQEKKFTGPSGDVEYTHQEFLSATAAGCANCQAILSPLYHDRILWLDSTNGGGCLCPECTDKFHTGTLFN